MTDSAILQQVVELATDGRLWAAVLAGLYAILGYFVRRHHRIADSDREKQQEEVQSLRVRVAELERSAINRQELHQEMQTLRQSLGERIGQVELAVREMTQAVLTALTARSGG